MLEHLYAALRSPLGICIQTDDAERLRQKLYAVRKDALDPDLACLSFSISPTDPTQLWILKKGVPNGPPEGS